MLVIHGFSLLGPLLIEFTSANHKPCHFENALQHHDLAFVKLLVSAFVPIWLRDNPIKCYVYHFLTLPHAAIWPQLFDLHSADVVIMFLLFDWVKRVYLESIQPFRMSLELIMWPLCNLAASQWRFRCSWFRNNHLPTGLFSHQWDQFSRYLKYLDTLWQTFFFFYIASPRCVNPSPALIWLPVTSVTKTAAEREEILHYRWD